MDKRLEIRCSASEFEAWKAAAGEVPLSRWVRGRLAKAAAEAGFVAKVEAAALRSRLEEQDASFGESWPRPYLEPKFRPDFKGGKR